MKYIIGNWKSHKNSQEVAQWAKAWSEEISKISVSNLEVVVCPSLISLSQLHSLLPDLKLGAQVLSPFGDGAYTGAVSARQVSEFASYALLGHVERRTHFAETDQVVAQQAIQALANNITPIIAVSKQNWASQLSQFDATQLQQMLVMYEPPEAISLGGVGHPATVEEVVAAVKLIQADFQVKGVLYGGSVSSENVGEYMKLSEISGVVPGSASLHADAFARLVQAASSSLK